MLSANSMRSVGYIGFLNPFNILSTSYISYKMMSLQDLIDQLDRQEAMRDVFEMNLDSIVAPVYTQTAPATNSLSEEQSSQASNHDCKNPYPLECLVNYTPFEGCFIKLWAHLTWAVDKAKQISHNIQRFRMLAELSNDFGDGPSPLQLQAVVDEGTGELEYSF